jgi:ADP-ribose pyrophosphatase
VNEYQSLMKKHPGLFSNSRAFLTIIKNQRIIRLWQKKNQQALFQRGCPEDWAKIGIVLDDPYFFVLRDLVKFPDQDIRGYSRIVARADLSGGQAVAVLPELQNQILLLHQFRHATRSWHFEIPRGYGEPDTSAVENARKEILEEIEGKVLKLAALGALHSNTGLEANKVSLFYAKLSSVGKSSLNEGIRKYVLLTAKEFEQWIKVGRITDGFTIAAYTRAKLKRLI